MQRLSTVASLIALCAVSASAALPLVPRPAPRTLDRLTRPDFAVGSTKADRKVSSRLRAAEGWMGPLAGPLVPADPPRSPDGKLQVYVDCSPLGAEQLAALEQAGVTVDGVEPARGRVRGRMDPAALDRVATFSWVHAVRAVDRAVVRAGSVTTEGDAAARADLVRAQGLDGSGVVVGVISDGIDHLGDAQQSGDLSDVAVPNGGCQRGSGDEGTALLEIVHDVAPGAQLLFAGPADSFEMVEAVQCLTAAGADVIVDDLGFFGEPFFQDGPVAEAVRAAVQAGVSYHSSAGNEAEQHLEQDFVATPNSTLHDFAGGAGDNTNTVVVPAGGTLTCILQWNDPFGGSANDYDLILLDQNMNLIAESIDPQNGAQDPIEVVAVVNQGASDAIANVLIDRFGRSEARRLELFCLGASALEHVTAAGSIVGHPALDEVVAVAAIDAADPGLDQVEAFSSRGPARVDFPAREDRAKPDVAGFDGVSISNAGGFPACPPFCAFFGTSAASPHTAGVAALLLQKDPSLTPAAVQAALRAGAVDIGPAGFDDASGFGRLDALASAEAVVSPQCASDDECADGDACTVDACDPVRGCVSTPLAGAEGVACRLGQLASPDVCGPGEVDARTQAVIAKRVASALTLLDKASQASGDARKKLLGKVARQLTALGRRVSRAKAPETIPGACASTLEGLIESTQALVGILAG
jgi:subtilisin family serine protease